MACKNSPGAYDNQYGTVSCCPGLSTQIIDLGGSDSYEPGIQCNPPPCTPAGQTLDPNNQFSSCCPPSTNQGGICRLPAGMVAGSFVSGPLPVTTGVGSCSGGNGWVVGKQSDCGDDGWGHHHWVPYTVDSPHPKTSLCPAVGSLASAQWVDDGNKTGFSTGEGGIGNRIHLQCVYSTITDPFSQQALNTFTGTGSSVLDALGGPQNQACDNLTYSQLITNSNCQGFYNTKTTNYDYQLVFRINEENSKGEWATNPQLLQIVQQVAMGIQVSGVTSTSSQGQSLAQNMITNYCLVQNPTGWVDNDNLRAIINNWVLNSTGNPQFQSVQQSAQDIVSHFCSSVSPTSPHCDCYNAFKLATTPGPDIFTACQNNTSNACSEIHKLSDSMAQAPPYFAPQIATLKSYITPNCATGQCVSAAYDGTSQFLAPSTFAQLQCKSDIHLCLESVKIGGSLAPGATINQNCTQTIGLPGNVSNQGFQNAQEVQAGGTVAAVSSPAGTSTGVTTTSSPSGTLQQQVTASAPVTTGSTGGPVSVTVAPTPGPSTVAISQNQEVAAAGTGIGLLGLSSSSLFFCCCVIIIILLLSMNKKQPAPRPIVLPGGF